jgi:NADH-quinone oxidoreductase subunit N
MENLSTDLLLYSPEIIIAITLCFSLIIQMVSKNKTLTLLTVLLGLVISAYASLRLTGVEPQTFFSNLLSHDPFSLFFKIFFIVATLFTFLFGFKSHEIDERRHSEFYLMILAVLIGMTTLVSSVNILSLYLSLELVSIVSYALSGFRKEHPASNEAAIKYLLYGAMPSGTMLWGLSLLYGLTGTLTL